MPPSNTRIQSLTEEVGRLRSSHHEADNQLHALLIKITEIQLNLATQDASLSKLDSAIQGNGKPGLITRLDRVERIVSVLIQSVWLLATASAAGLVKLVFERWK